MEVMLGTISVEELVDKVLYEMFSVTAEGFAEQTLYVTLVSLVKNLQSKFCMRL